MGERHSRKGDVERDLVSEAYGTLLISEVSLLAILRFLYPEAPKRMDASGDVVRRRAGATAAAP